MKRLFAVLSSVVLVCGAARQESGAVRQEESGAVRQEESGAVRQEESGGAMPARVEAPLEGPVQPLERVTDYRRILQSCVREKSAPAVLAIRDMKVEGRPLLLTVDPETLQTRLQLNEGWTCAAPGPEAEQSRYLRAVAFFARATGKQPHGARWLENAGLTHGRDNRGAYLTGDLCPSRKPLDRIFLLEAEKQNMPVALSVTGVWVRQHPDDFLWLRREHATGRLNILWVNHSFHHPFRSSIPYGENFILTPGLDGDAEIMNVERLLIANGETPSVFFRYPGLISDGEWMQRLRAAHLIPLGADSWLALGEKPGPGGVILVHPNGNEPAGLSIFERLNHAGALPKPLRNLTDAP